MYIQTFYVGTQILIKKYIFYSLRKKTNKISSKKLFLRTEFVFLHGTQNTLFFRKTLRVNIKCLVHTRNFISEFFDIVNVF